MSNLLKVLAAVLGGLCLGAVLLVVLLHLTLHNLGRDLRKALTSPTEPSEPVRILFLSMVDFDAGPVRLVLEPGLTGGDALLIEDQELMRRMAGQASIADPGVRGRATLLTAIFQGQKLRDRLPALRLYQNGALFTQEYCLPPMCTDPETTQSLRPLIAGAAGRVVRHDDRFTDHAAYAAAFARARSAPGLLTDLPREPWPQWDHPVSFSMSLPAVELPLAGPPTPDRPLPPETERALIDYADAIAATITDRIGGRGPVYAIPNPRPAGTALYDGCTGHNRPLPLPEDLRIASMVLRGNTDAQGYARLTAITDWSFLPPPPAPLLPVTLQQQPATAGIAPECLRLDAPDGPSLTGPITVSAPELDQYRLQWEEVVPLGDDDGPSVLE